jgi:hypothetical protein|tara:strand:+ start:1312 stop:1788 length:477 start_codon:yes stop_codon:yes gene_type:complete
MAHFAEIKQETDPTGFTTDTQWIVKRVVVVGNDVVSSDMALDGEQWCINFFKGGTWKQTSYNHNFRKQYAGIGYRYDESNDTFIRPQRHASWSLDDNQDWKPPIAEPSPVTYTEDGEEKFYMRDWDESAYQADNTKGWIARGPNDALYDWNGSEYVAQ